MGCDIHCYVEKRTEFDWDKIGNFTSDYTLISNSVEYKYSDNPIMLRNYGLFGLLAGVRGNTPYKKPRGLPMRVSFSILNESIIWGNDAHSHSYYYVSELLDMLKEGHIPADSFLATVTIPELISRCDRSDLKDVRIVFWFDN